ncbi:WD40 repeat-like protein [Suillus brevipes Sb2]|nr:WD40 repeat-like protein [Suillus brevipes Sb2]
MSQLIPSTTPLRTSEDHEDTVCAVAAFPDRRRMVTGSDDKTLRIWDLETGVVLKKMEGHSSEVRALAVSRDDQIIASADEHGKTIAWHGENGESLTKPIKAHSNLIHSVDFCPDGTVLATGSYDGMTKFWCTKTWQMQGDPIDCGDVNCIRYSPSGQLLAIATTDNIQIYNPGTRKHVASFKTTIGKELFEKIHLSHLELACGGGEHMEDLRRVLIAKHNEPPFCAGSEGCRAAWVQRSHVISLRTVPGNPEMRPSIGG